MRSVSRREALATVSAGIGVGIAGCTGNGDGNELVHIGFGGTLQEGREEVSEAWTEESGVEVIHESADSTEEFITLIEENPETYDVVTSNEEFFHRAGEEGVIQSIDLDQVPNFEENTFDDVRDPDKVPMSFDDEGNMHGLVRETVTYGIAYNSELTDGGYTSWDDLLREEFEGNLILLDRAHSRYSNASIAAGVGDFWDAIGNEDQMEEIEQTLIDQNEQAFNYWAAADTMMQQLQSEEAHIAEAWGGRVLSLQDEGVDNIEYVIPDEGCAGGFDGTGIPANADEDNLDDIHDYLNFQYTEESLETYTQHTNYPAPMENPPDSVTELPGWEENLDNLTFTNFEALGEFYDDAIERLELIKSGDYEL